MLGKLLKHEFRATSRTMLPIFGVVLLLSVLANFSFANYAKVQSSQLNVLLVLFIIAFFLGLFAMCIMSLVVMIERFYKNLLGSEGYLSFTLPVNVHELVWSKLIVSFVWYVVTGLVAIAAIFISVFTITYAEIGDMFRNLPSLSEMLRIFFEKTGVSPSQLARFILQMLASIILASLTICLHFYAALSLGHSFSNNKVLLSVVFFIAIVFLFQFLSALLGLSLDRLNVVVTTEAGSSAMRVLQDLSLLAMLGQLGECAILYLVTAYCLKYRLNLG